jgi:hypothetical protein
MLGRSPRRNTPFSNGARDMTKNDRAGVRRHSTAISRAVTQSVFDAFRFAAFRQTPLNTYVVINLRHQAGEEATRVFEVIRHKYRDWLAYLRKKGVAKVAPTYVFAFENPDDLPHVNWVVHIPEGLEREFARKLPRWVERAQGVIGAYDTFIKNVTIGTTSALANYILKGTQETHIDHFHLNGVYEGSQGSVWGKRAGSSPSIGKAARDKARFNRKHHKTIYRKQQMLAGRTTSSNRSNLRDIPPGIALRRATAPVGVINP